MRTVPVPSNPVKVRVLLFGALKDHVGASSDVLELESPAFVRDVLARYEERAPGLRQWLPSLAIAVNQQYASPEFELKSGDEVALLPPVSGGAPTAGEGLTAGTERAAADEHALITRSAIDSQAIVSRLKRGEDGAVVVFEGTVRNQTRGRQTLFLEYEAYEAMALREMESLAAQAFAKFQVRDAALVHRLGRLEIGEVSVCIVVVSPHRAAAFDACRWLIDTLKRTVPIWKKEHFVDGAVWADGEPFPAEIARANSADSSSIRAGESGGNSQASGSPPAGPASK